MLMRKYQASNLSLKIVAMVMALVTWYLFSFQRPMMVWLSVPVCFDDTMDGYTVEAPEAVKVQLQAKRSDLYALQASRVALHVARTDLMHETNVVAINEEKLFLPQAVKLVHCNPLNCTIRVKKI